MAISACVVGASGLVGREVVTQLCADAEVDVVHLIVRRKIDGFAGVPKIVQHLIDFDNMAQVQWPKCDAIFSCLGTTIKTAGSQAAFRKVDFDYVVESAKYLRQAGTQRFMVVSAMGADSKSLVFYNRVKGDMETAIASLGYGAVSIFRPSFLTGERVEKRSGERVALFLMNFGDHLLPKKYRSIPARAVARAMVTALHSWSRGLQTLESDKLQQFR